VVIGGGEFDGVRLVKSVIRSNFYVDARSFGVPVAVVDEVIRNLSQKIDFRRSLKAGDRFEILYNVKNELLFARVVAKRCSAAVYMFAQGNGNAYYYGNGVKVNISKNSSFGMPLRCKLQVSSPFGVRRHPLSGLLVKHNGVDLLASHGTVVYAIGEGVVTRASYYHGYGHCVDIRHPSGYTSRYAHLSGYDVRCGSRVKKGQAIGRVGSSGVSTGSHLHLELAKNNKTINPLNMKMVADESVMVPNMRLFKIRKNKIDLLVAK
jgi:murein DD-endopeptidase MepM/ murein hydrolase activator NlpD